MPLPEHDHSEASHGSKSKHILTNTLPLKSSHKWVLLAFGMVLLAEVIGRYISLSSNVADLGFFMNNFWNVGHEWQRAFYGHVQPLMLLWGAGYTALPASLAPIVLVVFQASVIIASVIAIWRVFGVWPGIAALLYYPLWVNALFDFHFDHLSIPILVVFFIACKRRKFEIAAIAAASLSFIKEPFALQTVACGLYLWWLAFHLRGQGFATRLVSLGGCLVLFGTMAFVVMIHWLIPYFRNDLQGGFGIASGSFSWLGSNLWDMAWTLVSKPGLIISEIIGTPGKLIYLVVIFGLLGFIPLLRPAALIVALPPLMISMLSRLENYYDYANHYTAGVIVPAIVAFEQGLPVARAWFYRFLERINGEALAQDGCREKAFFGILLSGLLAGHWALASSPISRLFWSDKVWSYSWRAYVPSERTAMMKRAITTYIPSDPGVVVSTQNTVNWYRLANRRTYFPFPDGVDTPYPDIDLSNRSIGGLWKYVRTGERLPSLVHEKWADYVVLDLKRPWFVVDKGCDWIFDTCRDQVVAQQFLKALSNASSNYSTIFEQDGFMILRRKEEHASSAAARQHNQ